MSIAYEKQLDKSIVLKTTFKFKESLTLLNNEN
jgi:hypothetical protein